MATKYDADEYADISCVYTRPNPDYEASKSRVESPEAKAKRVALLTARYSGLISKSQAHLHIDVIQESAEVRQGKLRRQRAATRCSGPYLRVESAEVRIAKLKRQRAAARLAARLALEKIEKTVEVYDPLAVMKEYDDLIRYNAPYMRIDWPRFLRDTGLEV